MKLVVKSAFRAGTSVGLGVMLCYVLCASFFRWFEKESPTRLEPLLPAQKIPYSTRSLLFVCLISSLGGAFTYAAYSIYYQSFLGLSDVFQLEPYHLLIAGLVTGLSIGMFYKGIVLLQHGVLRLILWRMGSFPWRYASFLDDATERQLLHKTKDGYTFSHPYLQDYFANSTPPPIAIDQ